VIASIARRLWRLLAAIALSLAAGIAVIAGWAEFSLLLRVALLALMMLLLAVPYFKKNPLM
jgi:hypothetical protein